jgi:hypothetical protein
MHRCQLKRSRKKSSPFRAVSFFVQIGFCPFLAAVNPNLGGASPKPPVGGRPASPEPPPTRATVNGRGRFALPHRSGFLSSRASLTSPKRSPTHEPTWLPSNAKRPIDPTINLIWRGCRGTQPSACKLLNSQSGGLGVSSQGSDLQTFGMISLLLTSGLTP